MDANPAASGPQRHILVIPSEEYVPAREPLAGIFQKNQIDALRAAGGVRLGVLSVRLEHSWPMYLKAAGYRALGRRVPNVLGELSWSQLRREFIRRAARRGDCLDVSVEADVQIVRATGLYLLPPNPATDPRWWASAGVAGYRRYVEVFGAPDLVHAHNALSAGLLAAELKRRFAIPYVLTEHSSYYHQGLAPARLRTAVRGAIGGAARHTVVSRAVRASLDAWAGPLRAPSEILPNVLPTSFEAEPGARKPAGRTGYTVLSVGNLLPVKGHEHLVRAFAEFQAHHPDARLRIAGEGLLREPLEHLAGELAIEGTVSFLGLLPPEAVRREMLAADLLALPSLHETFGVVLIEAMACGLPILATRCGGPEDLVDDEAGWLVEPGSAPELARGLERAFAERGRLQRGAVRERCLRRYGRAAFAKQATDLYESVLHA